MLAQSQSVVVQGNKQDAYRRTEATSGTKLAAPLRDIPQSIQVIPRQLIEDQGTYRTKDIVHNVSGVQDGSPSHAYGDGFIFRGFSTSEFLRDGLPDRRRSMRDTANVEQIEVLKGPASVLYGRIEPGGTLNYVTKKPTFRSGQEVSLSADSFGLLRSTADLSTVSGGGELGLRINGALEHGGNFRDFSFSDRKFVSAVLGWLPTEDTQVSIEVEALDDRRSFDRWGLPMYRGAPAPIPISRLITEPTDVRDVSEQLIGYTVEHRLDGRWQLKHTLRYGKSKQESARAQLRTGSVTSEFVSNVDPVTGLIDRTYSEENSEREQLTAQLELGADLRLGGMRHQVLFGLDADRLTNSDNNFSAPTVTAGNRMDIFNPIYGQLVPAGYRQSSLADSLVRTTAFYVQDLIALAPQWKALVGARYDDARNSSDNLMTGTSAAADSTALSPRGGLVWQPSDEVSVYASYSESFVPVIGQDYFGTLFKPTTGKQVELGAKTEWLDGRITATAAVFRVKKGNISVADPDHDGFSIQTGEITSEGLEFDVAGSPIKGLNLVANFAIIDVRITKDTNAGLVGRRPSNSANKGAGMWISYELQDERWRGLGGGIGATFVGDRVNSNSSRDFHTLPAYTRWDASLWYRASKQWRLSMRLENLFDKRYFASGANLGAFPGAPFNVAVTAAYRF
ncbi:MAG TPA: TonB-dependent siderophore receptor [Ideonella sp.]|nr:TonB-dependent siderophore receptor [Ideonella sp.]